MATKPGEAAPNTAATDDIGDDIMSAAADQLGAKLNFPKAGTSPKIPAKKAAAAVDPEEPVLGGDEPEDDLPAGAVLLGEETAEQKTAREAEETAAAETAAADEAAEGEETAEEKTAREAEEAKATAAANTPEAKAAAALAADTRKFADLKLKDLDLPEDAKKIVYGVINARIGKIHFDAKAEQARLEARVEELTTEVEEAEQGKGAPIKIPGVHPLFFAATEKELTERETAIEEFLKFAAKNPDGTEGDAAQGIPPWSAEEVQDRRRVLMHERDLVIPAVKKNLTARVTLDTELKAKLPSLFDRKSEEFRSAQVLLKQMPELRRHPNVNVILAKLVLGEKALAEVGKTRTPAAAAGTTGAPVIRKAPRAPGGGGPGRGSVITGNPAGGKPAASEAMKQVMSKPGDRKAFEGAVGALLADL